jgi:signal peptidase I
MFTSRRWIVVGNAMAPNVMHGWSVYGSRLRYRRRSPARGDLVLVRHPGDRHAFWVRRIVGLPGETIAVRDGLTSINGVALDEPYILGGSAGPGLQVTSDEIEALEIPEGHGPSGKWTLGDDAYFLLGDHRSLAADSRAAGPFTRKQILGKVWWLY